MIEKAVTVEIYRLIVWMDDANRPVWGHVDFQEWSCLKFEDGSLHTFKGKRAVVVVFSYDYEVTREMKLKCATDWMNGNYVTINVDLARLKSNQEKGILH